MNAQVIDCTTTQNMCLGCPKHPRSSRNSKVDRISARTKAVQNVRSHGPRPAPTVARCGMRSHTRMQALQPIPIGWRVHTAPRHRSRTAVTHSIHMPKTQLRPNTLKCAHRTIRPRGSTKWSAQLQPLPRATCALEAHRFGPFGPSGAARAPPFDSIATRISTASRTPASYS